MAVDAGGCRWAPQEPAPRVPSPAGAALHPCTRLPACLPAACLAAAALRRGPRAGGGGGARGPWQGAVAQAPAFTDPGTLAVCSRLGPTPASASIPHRTAPHRTAPRRAAHWEEGGSERGASGRPCLLGPPPSRRVLSASSPVPGRAQPAQSPQRPQRTSPARARCPSWAWRNAGDPGDEGSREGRGPGPREPRPVEESESGVSLPRPPARSWVLGSTHPAPTLQSPGASPRSPLSPHPPQPTPPCGYSVRKGAKLGRGCQRVQWDLAWCGERGADPL